MRVSLLLISSVLVFFSVLLIGNSGGAVDKGTSPGGRDAATPATKLTPNQTEWLQERLLPSHVVGNSPAVVILIRDMLPKASVAVRAAMNDWLAAQKAPSLERMLADARVAVLRQGTKNVLPPPSPLELPVLVQEYERQLNEMLDEAQTKPIFSDPLPGPESLREFRDLLWQAHVLNNTLKNAVFLATQSEVIAKSAPASRSKRDAGNSNADVASRFVEARERAGRMHRELVERAFELRVRRVALALKVLEGTADLSQRFQAAYAIGLDGEEIQTILKQPNRAPFERAALNAPELSAEVNSQVERGKELAGDLITKSRMLFAGLHWWRRGRYGRGPEHFGLVKSPAAQANLAANIALIMPLEAPVPTDPQQSAGMGIPDFDRRHHYWWSWENVKFEVSQVNSSYETTKNTTYSKEKLGHFDGNIAGQFY